MDIRSICYNEISPAKKAVNAARHFGFLKDLIDVWGDNQQYTVQLPDDDVRLGCHAVSTSRVSLILHILQIEVRVISSIVVT